MVALLARVTCLDPRRTHQSDQSNQSEGVGTPHFERSLKFNYIVRVKVKGITLALSAILANVPYYAQIILLLMLIESIKGCLKICESRVSLKLT